MERYKAKEDFIQYQLWQDCHNGCKFCSELNQKAVNKEWALDFVLKKLDDPEVMNYKEVGLIGGEIFDDQLQNEVVKSKFYQITKKISDMHFEKIYIATSLIFDIKNYLIPYIQYLKDLNVIDKVLLCTSYDLKYRFNKPGKKELWENNMLFLKDNYPELNTHVETILTQYFIDAVLNKEFSIKDFCEKYRTRIDYIEPASGMYYCNKQECEKACPGFFPTKKSFIEFLKFAGLKNKEIDLSCLISYQVRASRIYHLDSGQYVCYEDRRQPGFRVKCLDETKKYELGFIDCEDSMEDISAEFCKLVSNDV